MYVRKVGEMEKIKWTNKRRIEVERDRNTEKERKAILSFSCFLFISHFSLSLSLFLPFFLVSVSVPLSVVAVGGDVSILLQTSQNAQERKPLVVKHHG